MQPGILLLFAIYLGGNLYAQEGDTIIISTDRPSMSDNPTLIYKGGVQVETGFCFELDKSINEKEKNITLNSTLFRFGINRNLELRLSSEYLRYVYTSQSINDNREVQGVSSVAIGAKIVIAEQKGIVPELTFLCNFDLPSVGIRAFQHPHLAPSFKILANHTISRFFSFGYNLGVKWNGHDAFPAAIYTLIWSFQSTSRCGIFGEIHGNKPEGGPGLHGIDVGITYLLTKRVQVDLFGGKGITEVTPDHFIAGGCSWLIK